MPTSDYHQISDVLHVLEQSKAESVLDIGVGMGKWGVLCRDVLDVYAGRFHRHEWKTKIDGVEIFQNYRNPLWDLVYDRVIVGNAIDVIDSLYTYDVILLCDVIEHFTKSEGMTLLDKLLSRGKLVLVTSPRDYAAQGPLWGNPYEEHKSGWTKRDFATFPHLYKDISFTFLAVLSFDENYLRTIKIIHPLDVLGVKCSLRELLRLMIRRLKIRFA